MFSIPTAVFSRRVDPDATYDDVLQWWQSADETATSARGAVGAGAVCFVQLGGTDSVLVCLPPDKLSVRKCSKIRGVPGTAMLMSYAP